MRAEIKVLYRIGDPVHYVSYGSPGGEYKPECRPALVVTQESDGALKMVVLNPSGMFFNTVHYAEWRADHPQGGTFHRPGECGN